MKKVVVLILVIVLLPLSIPLVKSLSIDLIHRDSPWSPFYNASMTESDILINAAMRSNSRMKSIHLATIGENNVKSMISPVGGEYIIHLFLGKPVPVDIFAIPDTGSDLIWFQCKPCEECYEQQSPIYDPTGSTSYYWIDCYDDSCGWLRTPLCDGGKCKYEQYYMDKSHSRGDLAYDTISFIRTDNGELESFPKTIIGCGHDSAGTYSSLSTGVVGLGGGALSLVSQLGDEIGHIFSYCLLPVTAAPQNSTLKFGNQPTIYGDSVVTTPMVSKESPTFYYLGLESVSIEGGEAVKPEQNVDYILIDSGSALTYLTKSFYDKVEAAVKDVIGADNLPVNPIAPFKLCYMAEQVDDVLTSITFKFSNADNVLQLQPRHLFQQIRDMRCFLILPTEGTSVLGSSQQVYFQIEYDLHERTVSFSDNYLCAQDM